MDAATAQELTALLSKSTLSDTDLAKLRIAIQAILSSSASSNESSSETCSALLDTDSTASSIKSVISSFEKVRSNLEDISNAEVKQLLDASTDYWQLRADWRGYENTFNLSIQQSRKLAEDCSSFLVDLIQKVSTLLSSKPNTNDTAQFITSAKLLTLSTTSTSAKPLSLSLTQLERGLGGFTSRWASTNDNLLGGIRSDIDEAKDRIAKMEEYRKQEEEKLAKVSRMSRVTSTAGAIASIGLLFTPFAPLAAGVAATAITYNALGGIVDRQSAAVSEDFAARITSLTTTHSALSSLSSSTRLVLSSAIEQSKPKIEHIKDSVNCLDHIWGMIIAEVAALETQTDTAQNTAMQRMLIPRLKRMVSSFKVLSEVLRRHATALKG